MSSQDDGQSAPPGNDDAGVRPNQDGTPQAPIIPPSMTIPPPLVAPAYAPVAKDAPAASPWAAPVGMAAPPSAGMPPVFNGGDRPVEPSRSGKAIGSLVASLVYACGIGSIVGVVLGHLAWRDINRSAGRLSGKGFAAVGMLLGYVGLAVTLVVGGDLVLTALSEDGQPSTQAGPSGVPQPGPSTNPSDPTPNDAGTPCPSANFLKPVTPPGTTFNLGYLQRNPETGVLVCVYGQPELPNGGLTVLIELQDKETLVSTEQYFTQRELTPPTSAQLGDASGKAERFGIDEYPINGTGAPYRDTAAARGNLAAFLTLPQEFNIPVPTQFDVTVQLLDDIGVGSGSGSTGPGGDSATV